MKIKKVKDLELGQIWRFDNVICEIVSFPTRSMVCLKNVDHKIVFSPEWSDCKISIKELQNEGRLCHF